MAFDPALVPGDDQRGREARAGGTGGVGGMAAEIRLVNTEAIVVAAGREEAERQLSDAARSGQSRLAWFTEQGSGAPVGINPAHVVTLRAVESSS
jgi:hypothetical protein